MHVAFGISTMKKSRRERKSNAAKAAGLRHRHEAEAGAAGAVSGAALGAMAGPPGIIAGAVIGGIVGALASGAFEANAVELAARDRVLDAELGISEGDIGAPNLKHPAATTGAYSAAACGVDSSAGSSSSEGPMQVPD
jgi:hypothetical protein